MGFFFVLNHHQGDVNMWCCIFWISNHSSNDEKKENKPEKKINMERELVGMKEKNFEC